MLMRRLVKGVMITCKLAVVYLGGQKVWLLFGSPSRRQVRQIAVSYMWQMAGKSSVRYHSSCRNKNAYV